jgi:hypothetical protein
VTLALDAPPEAEDWLERYLQDLPTYAGECLKIRTKSSHVIPLRFNYSQSVVHARLTAQRRELGRVRAIILKARQQGVSTYTAARFFRRINLIPNQRAAVVADKKERAGGLFSMYTRFDKFLPPNMKPKKSAQSRGRHLEYDDKDGIGLGCEIGVETAGDVNAGRSTTTQLLHASELAFWPSANDVWVSLLQSMPDDDSEIIIESTANGVGGTFYELWNQAINGQSEFIPIFLPWFIHEEYTVPFLTDREREAILNSTDKVEREAQDRGYEYDGAMVKLSPEQLMWRRKTIANKLAGDARKFRQEYPSTWREAFLVSGACFFDEDKLRLYEADCETPEFQGRHSIVGRGLMLTRQENGPLSIWEHPRHDSLYCIGADTAMGKQVTSDRETTEDPEAGGLDFSAAWVFDVTYRRFVAILHGRMPPEDFARDLTLLGFYYSTKGARGKLEPAMIGVERNGASGETTLRELRGTWEYPSLFYRRTINKRTNEITEDLGWMTNAATRGPLLDELAAVIRTEEAWLVDADTIGEMFTFVRGENGRAEAQNGAHDDRVLSAALALQVAHYVYPAALAVPPQALPVTASTPSGYDSYGWNDPETIPGMVEATVGPEDPDRLDWW